MNLNDANVKRALSCRIMFLGLASLGMIAMLAGCHDLVQRVFGAAMLDRSKLRQTFDEQFENAPAFWSAQGDSTHGWKTNFANSIQDANAPQGWESRTIAVNGEGEYYGDPSTGMNPFEWRKGQLTIVGRPNPFSNDIRTHHLPYLSGLITTEKSFSQRYGYFEIRAALPMGNGIWPAFWLLPSPIMINGWLQAPGQQEIDIFESIGEPKKLYFTNFTDDGGRKVPDYKAHIYYTRTDLTRFHTYGVLVNAHDIIWYFDDQEVRRRPNLDFHLPAYMLVNLAVGGNVPGMPDATTPFPARLRIAWVKAYQFK